MYKNRNMSFANVEFLKHFAQVSGLLEPTAKDTQAKVKRADKMLMLPPLFDGEKPEKAKTHYKRFNQYIKFQTKEGNIKDTTREAVELFEHTLDTKALIWCQQHKGNFKDLTTMKNMFLARYDPWGKTESSCNCGAICPLTHKRWTSMNKLILY